MAARLFLTRRNHSSKTRVTLEGGSGSERGVNAETRTIYSLNTSKCLVSPTLIHFPALLLILVFVSFQQLVYQWPKIEP